MTDQNDTHTPDNYPNKLAQIRANEPVSLRPGEFLRYVLLDQNPIEGTEERQALVAQLGEKIDFTERAVRSVLLAYAQPNREMAQKLAALSGTSPTLWVRQNYTAADAVGVRFDMSQDLTLLNKQHRELGGSEQPSWHRS